jgi:predicted O-linked N-acetylglucosamine transferase (SPINDLY family)
LGNADASRDSYIALLAVDSKSWKGHFSLAKYYDSAGNISLANKHLALALQTAPSAWKVHFEFGQAKFDNGDFSGAKKQYQLALANKPDDEQTLMTLGACASRLGEDTAAKAIFQRVSASTDIEVLSKLAKIIWEYKYFTEAVVILKKIVSLSPNLAEAHLNLAKAQYQCWLLSEAQVSIAQALVLKPDFVEAKNLQDGLLLRQGKVDQCLPILIDRIKNEGAFTPTISSYLFAELYSARVSVEEKSSHHKTMMDQWVAEFNEPYVVTKKSAATKKIKIGLVSADFRDQHPVGIFVQPLLNYLDRSSFTVNGYYCSNTYDSSTALIREKMDAWCDAAGWADGRLREKIITDEIDILIDLSGHTSKHRLKMFAMRAAPVQATWMGYPHSTGLTTMDYMIADDVVCPPQHDHLCTETVKRLTQHSVFCFPPTDEFGEVDINQAAARHAVVFGSFNNLSKVNDETLALWRDVMLAVPTATLKLKTPSFTDNQCRQYYLDYFKQAGIAEQRLIFSGPSSLYAMMREYNEIDIALDTPIYNGGTTTFQALWMGAPVLTLLGDNFCGRMSASAMTRLNMTEWIAHTRQEYITIAKSMAADRAQLLAVKKGLRERMINSPLCDEKGFAQAMGSLLEDCWHDYIDAS